MKPFLILSFLLCGICNAVVAQKFSGLDKSPLDIAYYPDNFAHDRKEGEKALVKVVYSRPQKNNRQIAGNLIPYGKVWRTGANEATEIRFFEDAKVAGKEIKKGTYSLFTIAEKDSWTIIFNSDVDVWGAYTYNDKHDVLRVKVPVEKLDKELEVFTIQFSGKDNDSATMMLAWGDTVAKVPMKF